VAPPVRAKSGRIRRENQTAPRRDTLRGQEGYDEVNPPSDGLITQDAFAGRPTAPRGRARQLRSGRLELTYMPVASWHWQVILRNANTGGDAAIRFAGEQYAADSGFIRGGMGATIASPLQWHSSLAIVCLMSGQSPAASNYWIVRGLYELVSPRARSSRRQRPTR